MQMTLLAIEMNSTHRFWVGAATPKKASQEAPTGAAASLGNDQDHSAHRAFLCCCYDCGQALGVCLEG